MQKEIFISHSSEDKELVSSLIDLLQTGANISYEKIFCTSMPGMKVPNGMDFMAYIKSQMQKPKAIICVLTPNYFSSSFCMFEMGAAWAKTDVVVPLLVPPLGYEDIEGVLKTTQVSKVNCEDDINEFIERLKSLLGISQIAVSRWTDKARRFISELPSVLNITVNNPTERLMFREDVIAELPWKKVKEETKDSLYIWAWSGVAALNERTRNTLKSLLENRVKVHFMIINPDSSKMASQYMSMNAVCSWSEKEVQKDISRGREALISFRNSLDQDEKDCFYARETNWFMAWSGLAIDPKSEKGLLQVENYLYNYGENINDGSHLDYRPNILLNRKSKFFHPYWSSVENMWSSASKIS